VYRRAKDLNVTPGTRLSDALFAEKPWYETLFDDFRELDKDELPEGIDSGCEWTSVCINTVLYLSWLVGQCRSLGVTFKRAVLKHITEASALGPQGARVDIVINCSGLLASRLGGVMDKTVIPVRGQIILVRNELAPMLTTSGTDDGPEEILYVMKRASGGGTILGGTYQKGNWNAEPDPNIATRIMSRILKIHPDMKGKGIENFDIIRHGVGLRPYRTGGVRIEREVIEGTQVVHNYGHAGWGYQGSYGCAFGVLRLVEEILTGTAPKSKL